MRIKRNKHCKNVLLAIDKLHSTESILSKALTHAEISHEELVLRQKKWSKLEENIKMIESQRRDIEKNKLIKDGKKIKIDEMIKHTEKANDIK